MKMATCSLFLLLLAPLFLQGDYDMNRRGAINASPSGAGASGGGDVSRQNVAKPSTGASVIRSAPSASKSPPASISSFQSPSPKLQSHFGPPFSFLPFSTFPTSTMYTAGCSSGETSPDAVNSIGTT